MTAYYNENDPFAAAWLRELIKENLIAFGEVDERSIKEVSPFDLVGYTQHHFFAGIGGWSYALRLAGWPDERPVWTGSCPCQPFSAAGKRKGTADERHLWPEFYRLIGQCAPSVVFGEQVASKDGRLWLAGVRADLEALGYAVGAADLCAAGVGAPHIRQRLFWVADSSSAGLARRTEQPTRQECTTTERSGDVGHERLADSSNAIGRALGLAGQDGRDGADEGRQEAHGKPRTCSEVRGLADAECDSRDARRLADQSRESIGAPPAGSCVEPGRCSVLGGMGFADSGGRSQGQSSAAPARHWSTAFTTSCLDGKARRVEPSIFPLAHGVPNRVGTLRGAGNAIVPQVAAEFISACF